MTQTAEETHTTPENMTQEQKGQAIQAALNGLQCSMVVLQQFGLITSDASINVPGIAAPVAQPVPPATPSP